MARVIRRARGFTLVELLVVIAIIGILVSLLLPAVQSAREASRRASCSNNIKQISLALQNYADTLRSYPPGWIATPDPSDSTGVLSTKNQEEWGWSVMILPYMEQTALHDRLGVTKARLYQRLVDYSLLVPNNPAITTTVSQDVTAACFSVVKPFMCPSDTGFSGRGRTSTTPARGFNGGTGFAANGMTTAAASAVGVSNYMGVAGHCDFIDFAKNTGIFFGNSAVRPVDVRDGMSNTFLIGERDSINCGSGTWLGVRNTNGGGNRGVNFVIGHAQPKLNQPDPPIGWGSGATGCGEGFSSLHPNGAQFALCDGSVRFISNSINSNWYPPAGGTGTIADSRNTANGTYQRLMSRDDKLPVGSF
jgi:prepilin-type N-terminal cleavage/methylation domain-containing protein/prepilin-type processing-associated H-X9-DG protein